MEKYIIILLILLFGVVYYFDTQSDNQVTALEQTSTLETKPLNSLLMNGMYQKPPSGLIWPNIKWALVSSQDKLNERLLIQRSSKSDKSRCNEPRSIDEI